MSSPAKKRKTSGPQTTQDGNSWNVSWEHLSPLIDGDTRPLAWTPQNIILTPHPTLPQIHAQILPLAKSTPHKFSVPSPAPIHDSPAHFAPPKLISLSPGGLYLLAYFPPSGLNPGDGAACIWQKGPEATLWDVRHVWSVARGNGIVCCKWLCNEREWYIPSQANAKPSRTPPMGPPINSLIFVAVTQSHNFVLYQHQPLSGGQLPFLSETSINLEGRNSGEASSSNNKGVRVCTRAAIGLTYNHPTVLVATSSSRYPPIPNYTSDTHMFGPDPAQDVHSPSNDMPWEAESWGAENSVNLSEVRVELVGTQYRLSSTPNVASIPPLPSSSEQSLNAHLTHISFVSHSPPVAVKRQESEESDIAFSLAGGYIDMADYTSLQSHLKLWTVTRTPGQKTTSSDDKKSKDKKGKEKKERASSVISISSDEDDEVEFISANQPAQWTLKLSSERTWVNEVVSFMHDVPLSAGGDLLLVGTVGLGNAPSTSTQPRADDVAGTVRILNRNDIAADDLFEPRPLLRPRNAPPGYLPVSVSISPNGNLICTTANIYSPLSLSISLAPLPPSKPHSLAHPLALSLLRSADPSDTIRAFWATLSKDSDVDENVVGFVKGAIDLLAGSALNLEGDAEEWMAPVMSLLVALYQASPKKEHSSRSHAALRFRHLLASDDAFREILRGDNSSATNYTSGSLWQVLDLSAWCLEVYEEILREIILWDARRAWYVNEERPRDGFFIDPPAILALLCNRGTIAVLRAILGHIVRVKILISSLPSNTRDLKAIKAFASDIFDHPVINLEELSYSLKECEKVVTVTLEPLPNLVRDTVIAVTTLTFPSTCASILSVNAQFIANSSMLYDRSRLLVPFPSILESQDHARAVRQHDNIKKTPLHSPSDVRTCTRCGGRSGRTERRRLAFTADGPKRLAFEFDWERGCVCGGVWVDVGNFPMRYP